MSALRWMSSSVRCCRNTSASSMSRTEFHLADSSRILGRLRSMPAAVLPRSPAEQMYSGRLVDSATASAVKVLPLPGGPLKSEMIPLP